jgi:hypothetical protein
MSAEPPPTDHPQFNPFIRWIAWALLVTIFFAAAVMVFAFYLAHDRRVDRERRRALGETLRKRMQETPGQTLELPRRLYGWKAHE